ncbi:hypothetical protein [Mesorhizobium helmanticense]|uniref:hypothetical protein n=1 Tax=Mesorhizobium helmanticense TaxID=1776423 RepID=UPI001FDF7BAD|nr:hypothetical protein [Mesorhizobium helmanticense]
MRLADGANRRMVADHENRAARRARQRAGRFQRIRPPLGGEGRFIDQIDNGEGLLVTRHFQHRHLLGEASASFCTRHGWFTSRQFSTLAAYGNIGGIEVSNVTLERRRAIFEEVHSPVGMLS